MRHLPILFAVTLTGCVTVESTQNPERLAAPKERAEARIELGIGYLHQGNMVKARENLEKALDHLPSYYRAQLSMAHYFEKVGEKEAATEMYETALKQHPRNGNVLNNYGTFLCKHGNYAKADEYFNKAIEQPYYYLTSASYENAAFCALKSGDIAQAKAYFVRTLNHDPHRARALLHLAKLEIDDGDFTPARIRLMKFHQRYGLQRTSLELLAELEAKAGNEALEDKYRQKIQQMS